MRIFFSWSGSESRQVAEILARWLPSVLQSVDTYLSSQDIQKGERWGPSISGNLAEIDFGVVVLTRSNLQAPWVSFEAGALSKNVGTSHVIPILCDLTDSDLTNHPLAQFQYAKLEKNDLLDLVRSVNKFADRKLSEQLLDETFDRWWNFIDEALKKVQFSEPKSPAKAGDSASESSVNKRIEKIESSIDEILHHIRRARTMERASEYAGPSKVISERARREREAVGLGIIREDVLRQREERLKDLETARIQADRDILYEEQLNRMRALGIENDDEKK